MTEHSATEFFRTAGTGTLPLQHERVESTEGLPEGYFLSFRNGHPKDLPSWQDPRTHEIQVHHGDHLTGWGEHKGLGSLSWHPRTGEVHVAVNDEHQRKGLATAMWNHATRISRELGLTEPKHSSMQTSDGKGWAQSVGGGSIREHSATAFFRQAAEEPKTYRWTQTFMGPEGYEDRESEVKGPLYHGGGTRWREGQPIKPGRKPNEWGDEHGKSTHVYFTTNKDTAADYARRSGGHVFEVEPTGNFLMDHHEGEFKTKHPLTVVRRLDPGEWHTGTTASTADSHSALAFFRQTASVDDEPEHLDLYHRTSPENAAAIYRDKRMTSKERIGKDRPVYFSTFRGDEKDAQGQGYGDAIVHVRVPHEIANIDDEFPSGEEHYWVHDAHLKPEHFIEPAPPKQVLESKQSTFQQSLLAEAAAVDHSDGVMVALAPPREIAEQLAHEDGQPVDDLHITLAYLGRTADYTKEELALLPQLVSAWAVRQKPVSVRIGGVGKFSNPAEGQHVLWASADIPGGAQLHTDLVRYLEGHGYRLPSEHGWTPHLTLKYVNQHFRFLPHIDEHRWTADGVNTHVGVQHYFARFGTIPNLDNAS